MVAMRKTDYRQVNYGGRMVILGTVTTSQERTGLEVIDSDPSGANCLSSLDVLPHIVPKRVIMKS